VSTAAARAATTLGDYFFPRARSLSAETPASCSTDANKIDGLTEQIAVGDAVRRNDRGCTGAGRVVQLLFLLRHDDIRTHDGLMTNFDTGYTNVVHAPAMGKSGLGNEPRLSEHSAIPAVASLVPHVT
jgi:hypothetical protein